MLQKFFLGQIIVQSMAPIQSCLDIEKYKRHCAFESAAYRKHLKPRNSPTTQVKNNVNNNDPQKKKKKQPALSISKWSL